MVRAPRCCSSARPRTGSAVPAAATIQCVAQGEERFAASQGGTPSKLDFRRISQFQGSISRGGTPVANLTAGSLTYTNNLERIETIRSDGKIDGADPTVASLTGTIEVPLRRYRADRSCLQRHRGGSRLRLSDQRRPLAHPQGPRGLSAEADAGRRGPGGRAGELRLPGCAQRDGRAHAHLRGPPCRRGRQPGQGRSHLGGRQRRAHDQEDKPRLRSSLARARHLERSGFEPAASDAAVERGSRRRRRCCRRWRPGCVGQALDRRGGLDRQDGGQAWRRHRGPAGTAVRRSACLCRANNPGHGPATVHPARRGGGQGDGRSQGRSQADEHRAQGPARQHAPF